MNAKASLDPVWLADFCRRWRVRIFFFFFLIVPPHAAPAPPNILWITCEDMSPNLGCYGDPDARTPNIDRLAAEGRRYENAFSVSGVCAPSRSCLITGMYPSSLGTLHMRCRNQPPEEVKCFPEYLREAGYYCTNNKKEDYNFSTPPSVWDDSSGNAHFRNRPDPNQPFFAVFNFTITHESSIGTLPEDLSEANRRLLLPEKTDPARVTLPPFYPDTPVIRRHWAHYYDLIAAMDSQIGKVLEEIEEDGLAEKTIVFFFSDHGAGVPRCKRWLYETGTRVPLLIRQPGVIEAGTVTDRLVSFVDFGPTVLSLAEVPIPDHMQGTPFAGTAAGAEREFIFGARDRMDERYELIRAVRDKRFRYIRNYKPELPYDQYLNYPESFPIMQDLRRAHMAGETNDAQSWLSGRPKPIEELYDLKTDPYEMNNLATSAKHRTELNRLRSTLNDWLEEIDDVGFIPEFDLADWLNDRTDRWAGERSLPRPEAPDREIFGRSVGEWIDRIEEGDRPARLEAVAALGLAGDDAAPVLASLLKDPDPAVGYWAGVGLGRSVSDQAAFAADLEANLADEEAARKLGAADGLVRMGRSEKALPVLFDCLNRDNEYIRLHAALILSEIAEGRPEVQATLKSRLEDESKYVIRAARHALGMEPLR